MKNLKRPPLLKGDAKQQAEQLRRYLFELTEQLERELRGIERKQKEVGSSGSTVQQ